MDGERPGENDVNLALSKDADTLSEAARRKKRDETIRLTGILKKAENLTYPLDVEALLSVASHWGLEKEVPKKAEDRLFRMDPEALVPALMRSLDTPGVLELGIMGRAFAIQAHLSIPQLVERILDPDPLVRSRALFFLGQLKDTVVIDDCLPAMEGDVWRVRANAIRALGEILDRRRLEKLEPMAAAFESARAGLDPILDWLENSAVAIQALSVLARAVPLDYTHYECCNRAISQPAPEGSKQACARRIFDHLDALLPLINRWMRDIRQSERVAKKLMKHLYDPDPYITAAAAYSLAQMQYEPVIPEIASLLGHRRLRVRDSAELGLALFQEKAVSTLEGMMIDGNSAFIMLALDTLSRIPVDRSRVVVEHYLNDSDPNVKQAAERAVSVLGKKSPELSSSDKKSESGPGGGP
jgi:hypothetical protein